MTKDQQPIVTLMDTISAAIQDGEIVYITESHADAKLLRKLSLPAVCGLEPDEYVITDPGFFTGAQVAVLHNNTETGFQFAADMKNALKYFAHSVRSKSLCNVAENSVSTYLQEIGYDLQAFKARIAMIPPEYAPWITQDSKGNLKVSPDHLADAIAKHVAFLNVRKSGDQKQKLLLFKKGVYRNAADHDMQAMIRRYLPTGFGKSALLKEVQNLLLCRDERICDPNDLDTDMGVINFENCLLNIDTMELEDHNPEIRSTTQLSCPYDPEEHDMPVFRRFLTDLFTEADGHYDLEREAVLQEFCGLAISNVPGHYLKKALMLYSPEGNTGKSQILGLLENIIGVSKVANISIQEMGSGNRFALGPILGKRLICVGDQSCSTIKDSSVFKQITGGDLLRAEEKYQNPHTIRWDGTILFACNNLPVFTDDLGSHLFERFSIIPFYNVIAEDKRDPEILNRILQEKPAVINWMLEGLSRLVHNGYHLSSSSAGNEVMEEYRKRQDTVFAFISDQYQITKRNQDRVEKQVFQEEYSAWCLEEDMEPVSARELKKRLESIGLRCAQARFGTRGGIMAVYGIKKKVPVLHVA